MQGARHFVAENSWEKKKKTYLEIVDSLLKRNALNHKPLNTEM